MPQERVIKPIKVETTCSAVSPVKRVMRGAWRNRIRVMMRTRRTAMAVRSLP